VWLSASNNRYKEGRESVKLPLFLLGWRTFLKAGGADSVKPCPTIGGHPKGLGLDRIRSASFQERAPAKQKKQRGSSRGGCTSDSEAESRRYLLCGAILGEPGHGLFPSGDKRNNRESGLSPKDLIIAFLKGGERSQGR
jgi:hypothetical protein